MPPSRAAKAQAIKRFEELSDIDDDDKEPVAKPKKARRARKSLPSNSVDKSAVLGLPTEIICNVAAHLDTRSILALGGVCRVMRQAVEAHWADHIKSKYGAEHAKSYLQDPATGKAWLLAELKKECVGCGSTQSTFFWKLLGATICNTCKAKNDDWRFGINKGAAKKEYRLSDKDLSALPFNKVVAIRGPHGGAFSFKHQYSLARVRAASIAKYGELLGPRPPRGQKQKEEKARQQQLALENREARLKEFEEALSARGLRKEDDPDTVKKWMATSATDKPIQPFVEACARSHLLQVHTGYETLVKQARRIHGSTGWLEPAVQKAVEEQAIAQLEELEKSSQAPPDAKPCPCGRKMLQMLLT